MKAPQTRLGLTTLALALAVLTQTGCDRIACFSGNCEMEPPCNDPEANCPPIDEPRQPGAAPGTVHRSALAFDTTPNVPAADLEALAAGHYALAGDLLAQQSGNATLSPLSIAVAFSMLSAGARGETLTQLEEGLSLLPQDRLHDAQNALEVSLRARNRAATEYQTAVTLRQANRLFGAEDFVPESAFLDTIAEHYDASLNTLDFRNNADASRVAINEWVSDVTVEKIPNLLPQGSVTPSTRLVLVNAIYLKAGWAEPFFDSATVNADFVTSDGETVSVPTMHGTMSGRHALLDDVDVLELPLVGHELSVVVSIPRVAGADALAALSRTSELENIDIILALPKFEVRTPIDLVEGLQALGVTAPFDSAVCDLSGLNAEEQLVVTGAFHEAFVAVDEEGVEAAAATAIVVGETSVPETRTVKVDAAFHFAIVDKATGLPLFVGRIDDPRE